MTPICISNQYLKCLHKADGSWNCPDILLFQYVIIMLYSSIFNGCDIILVFNTWHYILFVFVKLFIVAYVTTSCSLWGQMVDYPAVKYPFK